jgi:YVTN family beta-propeller protein
MKKIFFIISVSTCVVLNAQTKSEYKIADKIKAEGEGGWDYLIADEQTNRLFVSHGSMVQVIDTKVNKVIGTIPDTKGVHGITLAHDLNKGFISNGKDTSVTVFDLKTLQTLGKIKITGVNPDAILYDNFSKKVFVYNGRSKNATVIDAKTDKVVETIALEGKPEFSVTDLAGKIYVNIENKNTITVINATSLKVEANWAITGGEEPTGLALDNKTHRLFTVCDKLMVIMDAANGKVISSLSIGEGCDGVAFDPELKRAYSSNGEGTVTVVQEENENTFKVIETIQTQKGARTICLNSKTHHLYLSAGEYDEVSAPTQDNPRPRAKIKTGSFVVLDIEYKK